MRNVAVGRRHSFKLNYSLLSIHLRRPTPFTTRLPKPQPPSIVHYHPTMSTKVTGDIEPQKDLHGTVTIVTGPSLGGIGYYTAKAFAERGGTVILAGRDQSKLDEAEAKIKKETSNGTIISQRLDLSDLESVEAFVHEFQQRDVPLNYLINKSLNKHRLLWIHVAGIAGTDPDKKTKQGVELQIGTNHLGHFYLTQLLLPQLKAGAPSRVVNVSSKMHSGPTITSGSSDNLFQLFYPKESQYSRVGFYSNSKLANVLHARVLNEQYAGDGITAYSVHPGVVSTEVGRQTCLFRLFYFFGSVFMKSPDQGAATTIYCALSDEALKSAGGYFADCEVSESSQVGQDMTFAHALNEYSDKLIADWKAKK